MGIGRPMPSGEHPQVWTASNNSNVVMTFWRDRSEDPGDSAAIMRELSWLLRESAWREFAIEGAVRLGFKKTGIDSHWRDEGSNFKLVVQRHGCSAEEFDTLFTRYSQAVLEATQS